MGLLDRAQASPDFWNQFERHTDASGPSGSAPTPNTGNPTQSAAPGSNSGDWQAAAKAWQAQHPYGSPGSSNQDLVNALKAQGFNVSIPTHAGGTQLSTDKIVGPDQSVIDLSNDNGWQWSQDGYFVNGQPSSTPGVVTPFAPDSAGAGSLGNLGGGSAVNGLQPGMGYVLPTAEQALNAPGLQFALQQGVKAVDQGASSKGTLLSGGTQKDEMNYAIGTALGGYNNLVNQQLAANNFNTGSLFNLANIGQNSAAQTGNFGANYANSAGSTLSGIGNANAANATAGGNAWAGALSGGANSLLNAYIMNNLRGTNQAGSTYA